jgi:serine/threonine-protein kinase
MSAAPDAHCVDRFATGVFAKRRLVGFEFVRLRFRTETAPTVSADGRWLAYASDETGRLEVYVRPFPDTKTAKRAVSTGGGVLPRWSRDGRELLFMDEQGDLIAVPVQAGAAFTARSPKRLFSLEAFNQFASAFEVGVDGSRFLMTRNVGGATTQSDELVVVRCRRGKWAAT